MAGWMNTYLVYTDQMERTVMYTTKRLLPEKRFGFSIESPDSGLFPLFVPCDNHFLKKSVPTQSNVFENRYLMDRAMVCHCINS